MPRAVEAAGRRFELQCDLLARLERPATEMQGALVAIVHDVRELEVGCPSLLERVHLDQGRGE